MTIKNPFTDIAGDISSTRIFEAAIIITVIIISFISVITGKDLGNNTANLLQGVTSFTLMACEGKKGIEYWGDRNGDGVIDEEDKKVCGFRG
jgi:hypothetical protein